MPPKTTAVEPKSIGVNLCGSPIARGESNEVEGDELTSSHPKEFTNPTGNHELSFMNPILRTLGLSILAISTLSAAEDGFEPLFDGKTLEGWTAAHSSGEGDWGAFSVNEEEEAIHTYAGEKAGSKQESDCLNTEAQFSHYILKLEYKWLGKRFAPPRHLGP
jgi:hypothetical protein